MITDKPRFPIREMLCHGWLPSFLKCALYRVRGYKIGHRVRIGFGSVICANNPRIVANRDGPGAKIGDGAVVGANSFVNHVIPSKCLATGSPARVVGQAPYFPRKLRVGDRETILRDILAEMVEYLRASELDCRHEGDEIEVTWKRNGWFSRQSSEKIRVVTELLDKPSLPSLNDRTTVFLSLRNIPLDFRRQLVARDILWFDIERKERSACSHDLGKEVAQYLRRHGVRFTRLPGETIN